MTKDNFVKIFNERFSIITKENLDIEIKFGAMNSTRGYFAFSVNDCSPMYFKFSHSLLDERYSDLDVIKVMEHEIIHYVVLKKYGNVENSHGTEYYNECLNNNVMFFEKINFEYKHNKFVYLECDKCKKVLKTFNTVKEATNYSKNKIITSGCCKVKCNIIDNRSDKNGRKNIK